MSVCATAGTDAPYAVNLYHEATFARFRDDLPRKLRDWDGPIMLLRGRLSGRVIVISSILICLILFIYHICH